MQVLPGSANLIGGRSATLRLVPARTVQEMKFPGAPYGVKMACGENPKRVYGRIARPVHPHGQHGGLPRRVHQGRAIPARVGRVAGKDRKGDPPDRDLKLRDPGRRAARGKILVQNHCYRADEMAQMLDWPRSSASTSAPSTTRSRPTRSPTCWRANGIAASVWADWWGFKMEAFDGIPENAALVHAGRRPRDHPLRQPRRHPAAEPGGGQGDVRRAARGHQHHPGAGDPLAHRQPRLGARHRQHDRHARSRQDGRRGASGPAIRSRSTASAEKVYNEGWLVFDRTDPKQQWKTDFNLGTAAPGVGQ